MKRIAILLLATVFAFVLAGCSNSSQSGSPSESSATEASSSESSSMDSEASEASSEAAPVATAEPQELVLKDSSYILSNGYVMYTVSVENPNAGYMAKFANITVTGKTADGKISFSDDWTVGGIMPGTTTYWSNQAGNGDTTEEDSIELSVSVNSSNWARSNITVPDDLYKFENVSVSPQEFGGLQATGEITLTDESIDLGFQNPKQPMLVCVLKDSDGNIVGGFSGYLNNELTEGKAAVFDISSYYDLPDYETVEMYANPW